MAGTNLLHPREALQGEPESATKLDKIVAELRRSRETTHNIRRDGRPRKMPSRTILSSITEQVLMVLFPTHYASLDTLEDGIDSFVSGVLAHTLRGLTQQVRLDIGLQSDDPELDRVVIADVAEQIVADFAAELPAVRALLAQDLMGALKDDPDAVGAAEMLLASPGMAATAHHRLAHVLFHSGARFCARLIASTAHSKTAIDIHPNAEIGPEFVIQHGTGVVVGSTAIIGARVRLHQGVTLGAISPVDKSPFTGIRRHPLIEDDVVICSGATLLGDITVGKGSVIGGNVWLTQSVPPASRINPGPPWKG